MSYDIGPADWSGFAEVMGEKGGCGGCWCMLWRLARKAMAAGMGAGNRAAMQALFAAGEVPGLVARHEGRAVGWIQLDRRAAFARLATSRLLKPIDDEPVWSVACFLVEKAHRRQGLSVALLRAAGEFAAARGARILEGYPVDPPNRNYPPVYAWTGLASAFRAAGFDEVARASATRPIMRKSLVIAEGAGSGL